MPAKRTLTASKPIVSAKPATGAKRTVTAKPAVPAGFNKLAASGKNTSTAIVAPPAVTKPAKPTGDNSKAVAASVVAASERTVAHSAAAQAVAAFYSGASKPFKAAGDRFQPLNFDNAKTATVRQAALLYAMLTYSGSNVKADGTFVRGNFVVPAKLVFDAATMQRLGVKPDQLCRAQPESGCLGNMLGRAVHYVSGPKTGAEQREQTLRFDTKAVRAELSAAFGDKAVKLCDSIFTKRA